MKKEEASYIHKFLEEEYETAENKSELDFWTPLSTLILETIESRSQKRISQSELAKQMGTRQSVISRFENMGRIPSYRFIANLSNALGHVAGITLYGEYMATVPMEKQNTVSELAEKENISTSELLKQILIDGIERKISGERFQSESLDTSSSESVNDLEDYVKTSDDQKTFLSAFIEEQNCNTDTATCDQLNYAAASGY